MQRSHKQLSIRAEHLVRGVFIHDAFCMLWTNGASPSFSKIPFFSPSTSVTCVDGRSAVWGAGRHGGRPLPPLNKQANSVYEWWWWWQLAGQLIEPEWGKLAKLATVKCKKLVVVWRRDVEISSGCERQRCQGFAGSLWTLSCWVFAFDAVYWLRCCICKTNRPLWSQQQWSHCHHLLRVLCWVSAFIRSCLVGGAGFFFFQSRLTCSVCSRILQ